MVLIWPNFLTKSGKNVAEEKDDGGEGIFPAPSTIIEGLSMQPQLAEEGESQKPEREWKRQL